MSQEWKSKAADNWNYKENRSYNDEELSKIANGQMFGNDYTEQQKRLYDGLKKQFDSMEDFVSYYEEVAESTVPYVEGLNEEAHQWLSDNKKTYDKFRALMAKRAAETEKLNAQLEKAQHEKKMADVHSLVNADGDNREAVVEALGHASADELREALAKAKEELDRVSDDWTGGKGDTYSEQMQSKLDAITEAQQRVSDLSVGVEYLTKKEKELADTRKKEVESLIENLKGQKFDTRDIVA